MKILMLKYYPVAISESFIRDQANLTSETMLYHGPFPVRYGTRVTGFTKLIWTFVKAICRISDGFYNYLLCLLIRKERPDLVFIQYGTTAARMYRACVRENVPFIVHFHGSDAHRSAVLKKYGKIYELMFEHASAVVVVSKDMAETLIARGAAKEKIVLNPCGIDIQLFQKKNGSNHFLSVGRFVPKKAPHHTLTAFAKVLKTYPTQRLVMIGDGPLLASSMRLAKNLGIANAVQFLGAQNRSVVLRYMQGCFVFLQHSVTAVDGDKEGSPVAITEAAACGIPVVSTFHAGIPDIVLDGETGFLVAENDVEGMAERMSYLIGASSAEYEAMSHRAREHALHHFDQRKQLEKLRTIVTRIVQPK